MRKRPTTGGKQPDPLQCKNDIRKQWMGPTQYQQQQHQQQPAEEYKKSWMGKSWKYFLKRNFVIMLNEIITAERTY